MMSRSASPVTTALATIVIVAAPAMIALGIFHMKGDPRLRPFGLTETRMTTAPPPVASGLVHVEMHWPARLTDTAPALELARSIQSAILAKGQEAWVVVLRDYTTPEGYVLFRVGHNSFGPYPLADAAHGIAPAIKAVRRHPVP